MSGSSSAEDKRKAERILSVLEEKYGGISWWPGDTGEVMIGAILTQQTRWENVKKALALLKDKNLCSIAALHTAAPADVEQAIRCTGFYRMKARRLFGLADYVMESCGGIGRMEGMPTDELRAGLLSVNGVGEETADSILCYGFLRPSFVIDAYTARIAACAGIKTPRPGLKSLFESVLPPDTSAYSQAHARIVEYAKERCTTKRCEGCRILALNG
jgi:endonuclease-3 related protein